MNNKIRFKSLVNDDCTNGELELFLIYWQEEIDELKKHIDKSKKDLSHCKKCLYVIKRNEAIFLHKPLALAVKDVKEVKSKKTIITVEERRNELLNKIKNSGENGISYRSLKRFFSSQKELSLNLNEFIIGNLIKKKLFYTKQVNSIYIFNI